MIESLRELATVLLDAEKRICQAEQALKEKNYIVAGTNIEIAKNVCQRVKKEMIKLSEI